MYDVHGIIFYFSKFCFQTKSSFTRPVPRKNYRRKFFNKFVKISYTTISSGSGNLGDVIDDVAR